MTLTTRVPGTPDPTLPPVLPTFGLDIAHFWHPRSYTTGQTTWRDEIGTLDLNLSGTNVLKETEASGRPVLRTQSTGNFIREAIDPAQIRTVVLVGKPTAADAGGSPYIINVGSGGITQAVDGSTTAATVPATTNVTGVAMDAYHFYAVSFPVSRLAAFAVDGAGRTLSVAAGAEMDALRIAGTATQRRDLRIAAAFSLTTTLTATQLTTSVYPAVRAWFSDLPWGA